LTITRATAPDRAASDGPTPHDPASPSPARPAASSTRRRIGLYGGSFDPVHQAHRALARAALDQLGLDELRWMPAGQPWQKARRLEAAEHRVAMLELVIAGEPRYRLERCEVDRSGPSYTLESLVTLQVGELATDRADWTLVIGQDQLANFTRWHGWQQILGRATLAVAARAGVAAEAPAELTRWIVDNAPARSLQRIDLAPLDHAATLLRHRLSAGEPAATLAPQWLAPEVASYIARHHLYAAGPAAPVRDPAVSSPARH
jgi:nicotinate-nucleotide adenylyltransferase